MPTYHKFEWGGFKVRAKPVGWRKIIPFSPVIRGNKPEFKVIFKTISGEERQLKSHIISKDPDSYAMEQSPSVLAHYETPVSSIEETVKVQSIGVSGNHRFEITLNSQGDRCQRYIFTFRAIAPETMMAWTIGILVGIAAIIVGVLNLIGRSQGN